MPETPSPRAAARLAGALLAPLGDRWAHTRAVAARAEELASAVPRGERELLVVAAWWHDLGYAPSLVETGMHQLDGARFLKDMEYSDRLVGLVAHHSAATHEARERNLSDELRYWPYEQSPVADALWTADMTTGPRGEKLEYPDRLSEILERYSQTSIVARAMLSAQPDIARAIERTGHRVVRARNYSPN